MLDELLMHLGRLGTAAARGLGRAWWWLVAGLTTEAHRPTGVRLLGFGVAIGLILGWSAGSPLVVAGPMPRPVTPPPPGMVWAQAETTGYCPCWICCGPNANGITSTGVDTKVEPFGIAVDPKLVPYRTSLLVPGYGYAQADDTGGAMRHDGARGVLHIDLRFKTHAEAKTWGVRWLWLALPAGMASARSGQD
jgi:3D (Asp-Asp-Asp) domain-containing protein